MQEMTKRLEVLQALLDRLTGAEIPMTLKTETKPDPRKRRLSLLQAMLERL